MLKFAQALLGADPRDAGAIAQAAEAAGFSAMAISDHVFYPKDLRSTYPYTDDGRPQFRPEEEWPDPWVQIGALSAVTTTLEFFTNVYVLPLRNPFVVAKAVGTAAFLSGDRVRLGVGAGWMREEFEQLGQAFEGRGARLDEMIEVLRLLWTGEMVEHHGTHYDFGELQMRPAPSRPVPILVGGHSEVALRRAARNDGWIGVNYSMEELAEHCRTLARHREEAGTADRPFEIVASPYAVPRPETVEQLEQMGVTTLLTSAWMMAGRMEVSGSEGPELVESFGEKFIAPLRS